MRKQQAEAAGVAAMMQARDLKSAAVARVITRRRPAVTRTFPGIGPGGRDAVIQTDGGFGFTAASSLPDWCDDVIARAPLDAVGQALIVIMAASRSGPRTGTAAVAAASRLGEWDQWALYQRMSGLDAKLQAAGELMRELEAEWRRLKLAARQPYAALQLEGPHQATDAAPGTKYSPGFPDELKPRWVTA